MDCVNDDEGNLVAKLLRTRPVSFIATLTAALTVGLSTATAASAFSESYGFYAIGNNGYVQSANAHTFKYNDGGGSNGGKLACQLFNGTVNEVSHGYGSCSVFYGGGQFVSARVYNQSGSTETVGGEAET
jgi:hypothetical protein